MLGALEAELSVREPRWAATVGGCWGRASFAGWDGWWPCQSACWLMLVDVGLLQLVVWCGCKGLIDNLNGCSGLYVSALNQISGDHRKNTHDYAK